MTCLTRSPMVTAVGRRDPSGLAGGTAIAENPPDREDPMIAVSLSGFSQRGVVLALGVPSKTVEDAPCFPPSLGARPSRRPWGGPGPTATGRPPPARPCPDSAWATATAAVADRARCG